MKMNSGIYSTGIVSAANNEEKKENDCVSCRTTNNVSRKLPNEENMLFSTKTKHIVSRMIAFA